MRTKITVRKKTWDLNMLFFTNLRTLNVKLLSLTHFMTLTGSFLYPLKTSENQMLGYWKVLKNFLQDYIETFFAFSVFVKFVILRGLLQILSWWLELALSEFSEFNWYYWWLPIAAVNGNILRVISILWLYSTAQKYGAR